MENTINSFKTIKEVEDYRSKINEECNERINFIKMVQKADSLSNSTFGYIKECFESLSPELFASKKGKSILNKYTTAIKESNNLSTMHSICEAIRKSGKGTDTAFVINKILESNYTGIDRTSLKKEIKSLGMILAEGYLYIGEKANDLLPKENKKLYSAIGYITENKSNLKNIAEYTNALEVIKENIENKEKETNVFESRNLDDLANELLEEFNKKYSESLNEEEAKALKEIASGENREEIFEKYRSLCAESILAAKKSFDEKGDENSSKRLSSVLEQVNNKKYSLDTIGEDICNLIELSNIFE